MKTKRTWRWWRLQFGLRSLLAAVVLFCLVLGVWRGWIHPYTRQRDALRELWPFVSTVTQVTGQPEFLRPLYKQDFFKDVVGLELTSLSHGAGPPFLGPSQLALLREFPRLERLEIKDGPFGDRELAHMPRLAQLESLSLRNTEIRGPGLQALQRLPKLKSLQVQSDWLERAEIAGFPALEQLQLCESKRVRRVSYAVRDCPRLIDLELQGEVNFIDLRNLPQLYKFDLQRKSYLGGLTIRIQDLPRLGAVSVANNYELSLELRCLPALRELKFHNSDLQNLQYSDLPPLETLTFDNSSLERHALGKRLTFPEARELRIQSNCPEELRLLVSRAAAGKLPEVISLDVDKRLGVRQPKLWAVWPYRSEETLWSLLPKCSNLRELSLSGVQVDEVAQAGLSQLAELRTLRLTNCDLATAELRSLSRRLPVECQLIDAEISLVFRRGQEVTSEVAP